MPELFVLAIGNDDAGGDSNLAIQTHYLDRLATPVGINQTVAQLVAFAQYQIEAATSYVAFVGYRDPAPGGGLIYPPFPTTEYGVLAVTDTNILPMTAWATQFGTGALAPRGAGIVMTKRTNMAGRAFRGRLTTPWLRTAGVTAAGTADPTAQQFVADGYQAYLLGDPAITVAGSVVSLSPVIYPADEPITGVTVTDRLGRVRKRGV